MGNALRRADLFTPDFDPAIIVCGRANGGKPHASVFDAGSRVGAETAAAIMNMHVIPVGDDAIKALAGKLPQGRIFGSGRAFVPFVSRQLYAELEKHIPAAARTAKLKVVAASSDAAGSGKTPPASPGQAGTDKVNMPKDWASIKLGSMVLASEGRGEGWYESVVIEVKGNDVFELKWLDWPEEPAFVRHRTRLALLHPGIGDETP
ncbi:hypothetical protein [Paradevosia shaoguanensis]|uniref:hypothetical protein n=1 Tax=Paradevosia shaoguanensis TaxID=1335043 RepID=UPI003C718D49